VNATATAYTADQGFAALEAIKAAKAAYDAIASRDGVGGFRYCPDAKVAAAYHEAGQKLFEVADYFFATLTGFKTLNDCLEAQGHGYRPTFREEGGKNREVAFLAETYDYLAETRGLPLRAYRPEQGSLPAGVPAIPECVRKDIGRNSAATAADTVVRLAAEGRVAEAAIFAIRRADDSRPSTEDCRQWFWKAADSLKLRLDSDRPAVLTFAWIKERCKQLREIAHAEAKTLDATFVRSRGYEVRCYSSTGGFYHSSGPGGWDGTLKSLKDDALWCREKGGDHVDIGGGFDCCEEFSGDYEPTDCEWNLSLTVDDILNIGKKG
jgi:hypothetical protein